MESTDHESTDPEPPAKPVSLVVLALISHPDVFKRVLRNCDDNTLCSCLRVSHAIFDIAGSVLYRDITFYTRKPAAPRAFTQIARADVPSSDVVGPAALTGASSASVVTGRSVTKGRHRVPRPTMTARSFAPATWPYHPTDQPAVELRAYKRPKNGHSTPPSPYDGIERARAESSAFKSRLLAYTRTFNTDIFSVEIMEEICPMTTTLPNLVALVVDGRWGDEATRDEIEREGYVEDATEEEESDAESEEELDESGVEGKGAAGLSMDPVDSVALVAVGDTPTRSASVLRIVRKNVDRMGQCLTYVEQKIKCGGEAVFCLGAMTKLIEAPDEHDWDGESVTFSIRVKTTTFLFYNRARLANWYIPHTEDRLWSQYFKPAHKSPTVELFVNTVLTHIEHSRATVRLVNVSSFDPRWLGLAQDSTKSEVAEFVETLLRDRIDKVVRDEKLSQEERDELQARLEFLSLKGYVQEGTYEGVLNQSEAEKIRRRRFN
jgi:hypothetical protein